MCNFEKEAGILLHVSSLPSKYGIGTFGEEAFKFVNFLALSKVKIWQILPLNVTSYGDSPYQSPSSKALNYYFIDLDILFSKKLLKKSEYKNIKWCEKKDRVDYGILYSKKIPILKKAFSRLDCNDKEFKKFVDSNREIYEFALFMAIKEVEDLKPWNEWRSAYKNIDNDAINDFIIKYKKLINFYLRTQYECFSEYTKLKEYANRKGIKIMGDIPIYVSYDSVEVWKHPELFDLDENGNFHNMAGHPADVYSKEGQLWGNPLYNWEYHKKTNYEWWKNRINECLKLYDLLRIDHFRGFSAFFSIPYGDKNAFRGKWIEGPGIELFEDMLNLPIVAEDLGLLDDNFYQFFEKTGYPGMRLINQAFDYEGRDGYWRPSNYTYNYFSYSSTHDSNTFLGLLKEKHKSKKDYAMLKRILDDECDLLGIEKCAKDYKSITYKAIELILASQTKASIIAMQDLLLLDERARMNFPSLTGCQNWTWRINKRIFKNKEKNIREFLRLNVQKYNRD